MIVINVKKDVDGIVYGVSVENHGDTIVCAAVSTLVINTLNSITELTEADVKMEVDEDGAYIDFYLENYRDGSKDSYDAILYLKSMNLGVTSLKAMHDDEIDLIN